LQVIKSEKKDLWYLDQLSNKGYALQSHEYRVYNKKLMTVEQSIHVVFDETNPKLQDQVPKNAYEEDLLQEQFFAAEKPFAAGNQSAEKEK